MRRGSHFLDKSTFPVKTFTAPRAYGLCPADRVFATAVAVAERVTCMSPMYINAVLHVDEGTMVDSHATVGSCAQGQAEVLHLVNAKSQIGGVLEPVGATPVILEDEVHSAAIAVSMKARS